jgi:hypothetical protein
MNIHTMLCALHGMELLLWTGFGEFPIASPQLRVLSYIIVTGPLTGRNSPHAISAIWTL